MTRKEFEKKLDDFVEYLEKEDRCSAISDGRNCCLENDYTRKFLWGLMQEHIKAYSYTVPIGVKSAYKQKGEATNNPFEDDCLDNEFDELDTNPMLSHDEYVRRKEELWNRQLDTYRKKQWKKSDISIQQG